MCVIRVENLNLGQTSQRRGSEKSPLQLQAHTQTDTHTHTLYTHTHTTYTHTHTHTHTHSIHTHTRMHTDTHTHTHRGVKAIRGMKGSMGVRQRHIGGWVEQQGWREDRNRTSMN